MRHGETRKCSYALLAVTLLVGGPLVAWSAIPIEPLSGIGAPAAQAAGQRAGRWQPHGRPESPLRRWSLQVRQLRTGTLRGAVLLLGSPLATAGQLSARIDGEHVSGEITGPRGDVIVHFEGRIGAGRIHGTYRDRTGETGSWVEDDHILP
jgi:hypothetical protein